jgi:hypothetical protein
MTRHPAPPALLLAITLSVAACDLSALEPTQAPTAVPAPTATPSPSFVRPTPTPGDTLSSIAAGFGTSAQSLAYWNRATYPSLDPESSRYDPNTIKVGWTLVLIPFAEVDPEDLPPRSAAPAPAPVATPSPSASPET